MNTRALLVRIGVGVVVAGLLSATLECAAQYPLDSWALRTVPGPSTNLNSIAYGNGVFVAVGVASFIARSTNGANWTATTAGAYGDLMRVRFLNGKFAVVGTSDRILYSVDGNLWTPKALPATNAMDVAFGNGVYVLAGSSTYVSSNGVDWTLTHPIQYDTAFDTVVFGNGGFLSLPTGDTIYPGLTPKPSFFSTNGVDWVAVAQTFQSSRTAGNAEGELIFGDGKWLATMAGDTANGIPSPGVIVSTDNGVSWCCRYADFEGFGNALAFGQGYYLYVESGVGWQTSLVSTSTNGMSWTHRLHDSTGTANAATFGNGTFVMVGGDTNGGSYIMQSGNVSGAPFIFQEPQDRAALAMNPATFSVQAVGSPTLTYQWYKNGTNIVNATNSSYTIASVSTDDRGGYQSVITNSFGSVTSRVAQLTVSFLDIHLYAGITVLGVPGRTYRIDATPASGTTNWRTITNIVLPSSPYVWVDLESPGLPARLYRVAELP